MKALLTGKSGFLGSHIFNTLIALNHDVISLGRSKDSDIISGFSKSEIDKIEPPQVDIIIHVAGKAHSIPKTIREEKAFEEVNYLGTKNLLDAYTTRPPKTFVFISSVAVYGTETGEQITEDHNCSPNTPYGISKYQAENYANEWGKKNNVNIVNLRLPLIIGKGAPGNLQKMVNSIKKGFYFNIGKGSTKRSMVFINDVAGLIPSLINVSGTYNLTDMYDPSFKELGDKIAKSLKKQTTKGLPLFIISLIAKTGDSLIKFGIKKFPFDSYKLEKMTSDLTFSSQKAKSELNWKPTPILSEKVKIL